MKHLLMTIQNPNRLLSCVVCVVCFSRTFIIIGLLFVDDSYLTHFYFWYYLSIYRIYDSKPINEFKLMIVYTITCWAIVDTFLLILRKIAQRLCFTVNRWLHECVKNYFAYLINDSQRNYNNKKTFKYR